METGVDAIRGRVRPASEEERREAHRALRSLSRPRLTGSEGAGEVETEIRQRFKGLGYQVDTVPFRFSTWPGMYGLVAAGVLVSIGAVVATSLLLARSPGAAALGLAAIGGALAVAGTNAGRAIESLPFGRREARNLLARWPGASPRYVIVAHRDSKSQPLSTSLRVAALVLAGVGWSALLALCGLAAVEWTRFWTPLSVGAGTLALAGGVLLARCRAGNGSPGALDNATGLAAALGIARRERGRGDVAFLITEAEELGMAGAAAAARRLPPVDGIINLDGLDDDGDFYIIERYGWLRRRRALSPHLTAAVLTAAEALGFRANRRDLPPGVLTEHATFIRSGFPAVTVVRGTAASLRRVHRPEDDVSMLTGRGVAATIALVAGMLEALRGPTQRTRQG